MNGLYASHFAADDPRSRHNAISVATRRCPPPSSSGNFTIESLISTAVNRRSGEPPPRSSLSSAGLSSPLSIGATGVMSTGSVSTSMSPDRMTTMKVRVAMKDESGGTLSSRTAVPTDYFRSVIQPSPTTSALPAYGVPTINPPNQPLNPLVTSPYHRYSFQHAPLQQQQSLPVPRHQPTLVPMTTVPSYGHHEPTSCGPGTEGPARTSPGSRPTTQLPTSRRSLAVADAAVATSESRPSPPSSTGSATLDALLPAQYAANLPLYAAWLLSERGNTYLNSLGSDNSLLFPFHKRKRFRTSFNPHQLIRLEEAFQMNRYMVGQERRELADSLGLTETQIKVWFQNRRTKQKKDPTIGDQHNDDEDDDDDVDRNTTSASRDCGGSLTSSSSTSESDYVDVESPGCHQHHLGGGRMPLSLAPSSTAPSSLQLLDPVRRGLLDMQATAAALHCSL